MRRDRCQGDRSVSAPRRVVGGWSLVVGSWSRVSLALRRHLPQPTTSYPLPPQVLSATTPHSSFDPE